jgi:hypothetical protein
MLIIGKLSEHASGMDRLPKYDQKTEKQTIASSYQNLQSEGIEFEFTVVKDKWLYVGNT